ncbi:tRNA lysidine(34) synthetase TilS [Anaerovorax odorimutans]|uniref:tRNA(Ile)-lysidine synthase n=1 Tax=Anaerovorax odorimutans TaxID=109327 RepID=A0ABT1RLV9_9FIRM|nr:tRNA lysidine(34) synthetase TilS [Anaerovorax odorimutans]MCQ4636168.1 tRNA lysidine(34) synthetase TilS [Anaerovorax odorimutans]
MVREKIKKTIFRHNLIQRGEHIVIGLSGGPDSVCLFHVLKTLSAELGFSLYAVHVNHKFRPGAAEEDQAYVEELCGREGIPCETVVRDCLQLAGELGMTGEEAGRKVRYEAFDKMGQKLVQSGIPAEKIKIAVAQNANDQAETVLLRLLRGTGPDGLAGMAYLRREGDFAIIRPLLDVKRQEIETYCHDHKLNPRIDETNLQPIYTRNKVRLQLIPYLEEHFNGNIEGALVRLAKIAGEDKEYLWKITQQSYKEIMIKPGVLELEGLKGLDAAIRHRVLRKAFADCGLDQDITERHLAAADQLLLGGETSKTLDFPGGYRMTIGYDEVRFYKEPAAANETDSWQETGALGLRTEVVRAGRALPPGAAAFDWEKICMAHGEAPGIELRKRRPGDYIRLKNGRKKLQDFFVDRKVPKEDRESVPLAAIGSEILWIIADGKTDFKSHRYSEKYKLDSSTKMVLVLEIICEM